MSVCNSSALTRKSKSLQKAYQIYTSGIEDQTNGSHTIWRLANRAHIQLEESETIQYLADFYGLDDPADKWLLAAFNTKDDDLMSTEFTRGNVNFSSVGIVARSGEFCMLSSQTNRRGRNPTLDPHERSRNRKRYRSVGVLALCPRLV